MSNSSEELASAVRAPTVEVPKPTIWPMMLSLSLALSALGVALGAVVFVVIGGLLLAISLCRWFNELLPGNGQEEESMMAPGPSPVAVRTGMVEQLRPGMVGYRIRLPEKHHPISSGLIGGLVGGLVMPVPALAWSVLSGHGLFFPVNLLAGMALPGIQNLTVAELEQFRPVLLAVGVVIHAVMSTVIGVLYGVLLPTIPTQPRWQIAFCGVIIPLVWTGVSGGLMGVVNPLLQHSVNWFWFAVSQMVFGLAAAVVIVRSEKVIVPPAGRGIPATSESERQ